MLKKKVLKSVIGTFCSILILFSGSVDAFAYSADHITQDGSKISAISDNQLLVTSGDSKDTVTVIEADRVRTVTIIDLISNKENKIVFDYNSKTIYSTYTGKTVQYSDREEMTDSLYFDRAPDVSYTKVKKSYTEIRQILGDTSTASGIVGFIIGFIPGAQPVATLIGSVSAIMEQDLLSYQKIQIMG